MTTDARKLEGLLRNDFRAFIHKVFTTLCPGQDYERSWHIEAIAYQLERVRRGEITRLIINMPPRSLKSISASVAFPAFVLGRDPSRRIICVSYSGDLAKKHSNDFRAVARIALVSIDLPHDADLLLTRTRKPRLSSPRAGSGWRRRSAAPLPGEAATPLSSMIHSSPMTPCRKRSGPRRTNGSPIRCSPALTTNARARSSSSCSASTWTI